MRWRVTFLFATLLLLPLPAFASPGSDLEKTQAEIAASKAKQVDLDAKNKRIALELDSLQKKLVRLASQNQETETDWEVSHEKMMILRQQVEKKNVELEERRSKLAQLTRTALHLSQMPPEAMMVESDNENAMKVARALKMTSDSIRDEMESIRLQTDELRRLQKKMEARKVDFDRKQATLDEERAALAKKLDEKKELQKQLGLAQEEESKKIEQLAKKAESLQALVAAANRNERKSQSFGGKRSFADAKGKLIMPVSGQMVQRFGAAKAQNTNKGIVLLAGASGAQVLAPFDGEVVYTGSFLNYGKLVILRHSDDFHTLLAGLDEIDAGVGDFLLEGEPIGAMGDSETDRRLYFELRKANQPVNPEPWIKKLNKKI